MKINHLKKGYSDYVFQFIKKHINELNPSDKILDVGAGHLRNLKLFSKIGFKNLHALDREPTDNPLKVPLKSFKLHDIELGLPYDNGKFDIVLCNFVLMFVDPQKIEFVVAELLRVTKRFLIIETNPRTYDFLDYTFHEDYNFQEISNLIQRNSDFKIIQIRKQSEKLVARRKE